MNYDNMDSEILFARLGSKESINKIKQAYNKYFETNGNEGFLGEVLYNYLLEYKDKKPWVKKLVKKHLEFEYSYRVNNMKMKLGVFFLVPYRHKNLHHFLMTSIYEYNTSPVLTNSNILLYRKAKKISKEILLKQDEIFKIIDEHKKNGKTDNDPVDFGSLGLPITLVGDFRYNNEVVMYSDINNGKKYNDKFVLGIA